MSQHLFICTIGPVQSFIAQARKAQDLWAGSQLLSELITEAIRQARKTSNQFECIFPYEHATTKPNRFVAKVEVENIKKFGDELKDWIKAKLLEIAKNCFKDNRVYELSKLQLEDFLEIYWAAVSYDELNYSSNYGFLERTLGAVKNYRAYSQFSEQGRKCAMNGFYNALFYRRSDKDTDVTPSLQERKFLDKKGLVFNYFDPSKLQKGEGLCGISFLKRFYKADKAFPSVSNVALMHLWQDETIKNSNEFNKVLLCDGKSLSKIDEFNAQLLYSENINEDYFKQQDITKCTVDVADTNLKQLSQIVKEKNLKFNKYYAIVLFDVDSMGSHVSASKSIIEHQCLSRKLSDYATWATSYVDNKGRGKTIYAGGDDFMGMLNLNTLFETIEALRKEFSNQFNAEGFTFSAGIAIAHYKTPLGEVLNYARKMEHKAKDRDGKNAFGIAVLKHSGEIHEMVLPWFKGKGQVISNQWFTQFLKEINEDLKENISPKFIKTLNDELSIWEDMASEFRPMANYEIDRLIERAKKTKNQEIVKRIQGNVKHIYLEISTKEPSIQYFINAMNVADFINRKM